MEKTPNIITTELVIDGLKNSYRFLHITDLHLVCCYATESEKHREFSEERKEVFLYDGEYPDDRTEEFLRYINDNAADISGVLMTGDILDFPSDENLDAFGKIFDEMPVPCVYVLGNHDWSWELPDEYHSPESKVGYIPKFGKFCGGNSDRFRSMITAKNSPVKAVVCGHLHFHHEDMIDGKIPQITISLSSFSFARMIEIHG